MQKKLAKSATSSSLATTATTASSASTAFTSVADSATTSGRRPSAITSPSPDGGADLPFPRLVVFDLDYTLWPFWIDTHVTPPLKAVSGLNPVTAAADRTGEHYAFYGDVPRILHALQQAPGVKIGVASRTHAPDLARDLLKLLYVPSAGSILAAENASNGNGRDGSPLPPLDTGGGGLTGRRDKARRALDFFDGGMEIYPGSKIRHMEALQKRTGVAFTDMLFFDDESRNREVETLGVTMWLVRDGMSWDELERGVTEWRRRRGVVSW